MSNPHFFKTAKDFLAAIEKYRDKCAREEKKIILTGLILGIGFKSKQAFYNQRERGADFEQAVDYARLLIENAYESGGVDGTIAPPISIFALKNFDWSDKSEHELYGKDGQPLTQGLDDEERILRLEALISAAEKRHEEP